MNGSRATPPRHGETSSLDALSRTIEGLEARIEGLMGTTAERPDPRHRPAADYGMRPEPAAARDRYRETPVEREARPDPLAEIRQRQRMLEASRERPAARAERPASQAHGRPVDPRGSDPRHQSARAHDPRIPEAPIPDPRLQDPRRHDHRGRDAFAQERAPEPRQRAAAHAPAPVAPAVSDTAMKEIAQALVSLRQELKQDISEGVAREMGTLRNEIRSIKSSAEDQNFAVDVRDDLARLSQSISQLGSQPAAHGDAEGLRAEFEELRLLMDGLAREESVRHMEMRWNGVEDRIHALDTAPLQEELVSLAYRLDDIKTQLGSMSANPAIRALEEKLITIAQALEMLGDRMQPDDRAIAEQFAGLDLRLDEISRAIVAGTRSANAFDPTLVQRLESRLGALAEQIDGISREAQNRPDPAAALGARIEALTARIEELTNVEAAARLDERLEQLAILMERSQRAPPAPELTGFLADISRKIDALETGSVNDVLAERLDYLARRIDEMEFQPPRPAAAFVDDGAFRRIEGQLSDIAARLDETTAAPPSDHHALKALESQIAHLSLLISEPRPDVALSPAFETRMTAIEDYMATSDEYIIEAARQAAEAVVEAYSRNGMGNVSAAPAADMSALAGLAEDLRHLEDLSRSSEQRTQQTFEALHETLVQIAGRLEDMDGRFRGVEHDGYDHQPEQRAQPAMPKAVQPVFAEPAFDEQTYDFASSSGRDDFDGLDGGLAAYPPRDMPRAPDGMSAPVIRTLQDAVLAEADEFSAADTMGTDARPAGKRGLLASLGKRFLPGRKAQPASAERTTIEPTPPLAPEDMIPADEANELLEPGSGAPDVKKILERVRASQNAQRAAGGNDGDRADYIAAARRAAQAAAQEVDQTQRLPGGNVGKGLGTTFSKHRRPILMAVGAVLLVMMTIPLVGKFTRSDKPVAAVETTATDKAAEIAPVSTAPASGAENAGIDPAATQTADSIPATTETTGQPFETTDPATTQTTANPLLATAPLGGDGAAQGLTRSVTGEAGEGASAFAPTDVVPADASAMETTADTTAITVPEAITPKSLADAANAGDPAALFEIGARYTEGRGVKTDLVMAAKWYQMAADKGLAPAQYRIANLYEKGTGVERDLAKAQSYYQQAADKGNASAMHNLAVLLATGIDGKPDFDTAVNWFNKAANLGVSDSQFNLAILYARGNGVKQDLEESYKWFAIAAKDGDKDAAQKRDEVANAMRPEQLESARAKVDLWKPQTLDNNANSVNLPDEWVGKGTKTASVDMKKAVRNIQAILNNNGFDAGTPDGEMGKKTVNAIKAFQKSIGQEADGKITDALVKELLARNK